MDFCLIVSADTWEKGRFVVKNLEGDTDPVE